MLMSLFGDALQVWVYCKGKCNAEPTQVTVVNQVLRVARVSQSSLKIGLLLIINNY